MFFLLSKLLTFLLKPLVYVAVLLTLGVWSKHKKRAKVYTLSAWVLLLFFSNSMIVNGLFGWYEGNPTPFDSLRPPYRFGVVLTGVADVYRKPYDRTYFQKGADRATHALQLYRMGYVQSLIISGETGRLESTGESEAERLRAFFLMAGIPDSALKIETESKNTYQNAINTHRILDSLNALMEPVVLITSGFHMKRASGCFSAAGIQHVCFSTDFFAPAEVYGWRPDQWLLPSASAVLKWEILLKEWFGILVYSLAGYM
jgi:uncharacterized SAM-binding protein YcdF (DUF218 family)